MGAPSLGLATVEDAVTNLIQAAERLGRARMEYECVAADLEARWRKNRVARDLARSVTAAP
jgi:hypothetical protein